MLGDESGVVREEGWVERVFDASDVEATVFCKGVIAVEEQRKDRQGGQGE